MSYDTLVRNQVKKAFNMVKDLAESVTLSSQSAAGYDFGAGSATLAAVATKVVKGIFQEQRRDFPKAEKQLTSTIGMTFMFMASDMDDPTLYDTITRINGEVWTMVPPYKNDGFLITANLSRKT